MVTVIHNNQVQHVVIVLNILRIFVKDDDNNTWWEWYYGDRCIYDDESRCDHHARIELTNEGQLRVLKTSSGSQLRATAPLPPDVVEKIEPYPEWANEDGDYYGDYWDDEYDDYYGNRPITQYGPYPDQPIL